MNDHDLETMLDAYVAAALWSSTDESRKDGGDPLDENYSADDIAEETLERMRRDCRRFGEANAKLIESADMRAICEHMSAWARAGHDFWLTRNGHGTGFWDRPEVWGEEGAQELTKACRKFGNVDLVVTEEGKVSI